MRKNGRSWYSWSKATWLLCLTWEGTVKVTWYGIEIFCGVRVAGAGESLHNQSVREGQAHCKVRTDWPECLYAVLHWQQCRPHWETRSLTSRGCPGCWGRQCSLACRLPPSPARAGPPWEPGPRGRGLPVWGASRWRTWLCPRGWSGRPDVRRPPGPDPAPLSQCWWRHSGPARHSLTTVTTTAITVYTSQFYPKIPFYKS